MFFFPPKACKSLTAIENKKWDCGTEVRKKNGMTSPVWLKENGRAEDEEWGRVVAYTSPHLRDGKSTGDTGQCVWRSRCVLNWVPIYPTTIWIACTSSPGSTPGPSCSGLSQRAPPEQDTCGCSKELLKRTGFRYRRTQSNNSRRRRLRNWLYLHFTFMAFGRRSYPERLTEVFWSLDQ